MRSVKFLLAAGAASLLSSTAVFAADMPIAPPPAYAPPPIEDFGGWYLRGDIGMTNQRYSDLNDAFLASVAGRQWLDKGGFDSGMLYGFGVGYQFNNWFRADLTGQYRGRTKYTALDSFMNGAAVNTNHLEATKSEWLLMANGYVDLGTWWCVTPFVGAGIGAARVTLDNWRDTNVIAGGGAWAPGASTWNFAWAAHAGLAYRVSPSFTVELAYSYVSLGSGRTGDPRELNGNNPLVGNYVELKDITSHDIKFGVRWNLDAPPVYVPPPPLIRKG